MSSETHSTVVETEFSQQQIFQGDQLELCFEYIHIICAII